MNSNDRLGAGPISRRKHFRIEATGILLDIDKDGCRSNHSDGSDCCTGRMRYCDDLVAFAHMKRLQGERQRIGSRRDAYRGGCAEASGQLMLERADEWSKYILAGGRPTSSPRRPESPSRIGARSEPGSANWIGCGSTPLAISASQSPEQSAIHRRELSRFFAILMGQETALCTINPDDQALRLGRKSACLKGTYGPARSSERTHRRAATAHTFQCLVIEACRISPTSRRSPNRGLPI